MQLNVNNATRNKIIKDFIYMFSEFFVLLFKKINEHLVKTFVAKALRKIKI